jgi:transcriptional regulator with XRE-family HTH domain
MAFPDRLKQAIEDRGFNQSSLARTLGVSQTTVSRWERGENTPSEEEINKLCYALRVNRHWLVGGEGPRTATWKVYEDPGYYSRLARRQEQINLVMQSESTERDLFEDIIEVFAKRVRAKFRIEKKSDKEP